MPPQFRVLLFSWCWRKKIELQNKKLLSSLTTKTENIIFAVYKSSKFLRLSSSTLVFEKFYWKIGKTVKLCHHEILSRVGQISNLCSWTKIKKLNFTRYWWNIGLYLNVFLVSHIIPFISKDENLKNMLNSVLLLILHFPL